MHHINFHNFCNYAGKMQILFICYQQLIVYCNYMYYTV